MRLQKKGGGILMKKKIISAILLLGTVFLMACGSFTCDLCGQEKNGKKYEYSLFGEKGTICKDCYKGLQELKDAFQ